MKPTRGADVRARLAQRNRHFEAALVAGLLYGSGLRLMEALRLPVKDVDLPRREITVRDGKGGKDRLMVLPQSLVPALQDHLLRV